MCCIMDNYVEKESITYYKDSVKREILIWWADLKHINAILNGSNLTPNGKGVLCMFDRVRAY